MEKTSIQIQTVLYHNEVDSIVKSISNIANALAIYRKNVGDLVCHLCYGDASKTPMFSEEAINAIKEKYPAINDIKYIFFNENTGTSKGHNKLAEKCEADYITVMNPDILISSRFFVNMLSPFCDDSVGLTEARQTPIEHPKEYDISTFETAWSTGACFVCPTRIYHEINGFDEESFFMYCDDVDFSWRVRLHGYRLIYKPEAVVYHAKRLSSGGAWQPTEAEIYYSAEAALLMAYKWSNTKKWKKMLWDYQRSRNSVFKKAAKEFKVRKKEGRLPEQLDKEGNIATFFDGEYSNLRFRV